MARCVLCGGSGWRGRFRCSCNPRYLTREQRRLQKLQNETGARNLPQRQLTLDELRDLDGADTQTLRHHHHPRRAQ